MKHTLRKRYYLLRPSSVFTVGTSSLVTGKGAGKGINSAGFPGLDALGGDDGVGWGIFEVAGD